LKHSQADIVVVHLTYSDEFFMMEIKDNGIGFNVTEKRQSTASFSGVGLKSIFNRARLIGAEISMESVPAHGTTILIQLPLESQ
jgi:signal transduction histidine kinase